MLFFISMSFCPECLKAAFAQEKNNMEKTQVVELVELLEAEINVTIQRNIYKSNKKAWQGFTQESTKN